MCSNRLIFHTLFDADPGYQNNADPDPDPQHWLQENMWFQYLCPVSGKCWLMRRTHSPPPAMTWPRPRLRLPSRLEQFYFLAMASLMALFHWQPICWFSWGQTSYIFWPFLLVCFFFIDGRSVDFLDICWFPWSPKCVWNICYVAFKGKCHEIDMNIWTSTFCICANGFQALSKAIYYPIQFFTFYCFLLSNCRLILKCIPLESETADIALVFCLSRLERRWWRPASEPYTPPPPFFSF